MNPLYRVAALAMALGIWVLPFVFRKRRSAGAVKIDPRARWGILVVGAGFFCAYIHSPRFWNSPVSPVRIAIGIAIAAIGIGVARNAVGNLGRQWRIDAGLNADHELVMSGVYRIVRHPIYFSMFLMLLTVIALAGTLPGWPAAIVLFAIGTEIRVRVEDNLLHERFGARFEAWQRSVPAWIPFIR